MIGWRLTLTARASHTRLEGSFQKSHRVECRRFSFPRPLSFSSRAAVSSKFFCFSRITFQKTPHPKPLATQTISWAAFQVAVSKNTKYKMNFSGETLSPGTPRFVLDFPSLSFFCPFRLSLAPLSAPGSPRKASERTLISFASYLARTVRHSTKKSSYYLRLR